MDRQNPGLPRGEEGEDDRAPGVSTAVAGDRLVARFLRSLTVDQAMRAQSVQNRRGGSARPERARHSSGRTQFSVAAPLTSFEVRTIGSSSNRPPFWCDPGTPGSTALARLCSPNRRVSAAGTRKRPGRAHVRVHGEHASDAAVRSSMPTNGTFGASLLPTLTTGTRSRDNQSAYAFVG